MDALKTAVTQLVDWVSSIDWLGPALAGGLANYLAQPRKDNFFRWLLGMVTHFPVALFFGWLMGLVAVIKGYSDMEISLWSAGGAYLGSQIAEIFLYAAYRYAGRRADT